MTKVLARAQRQIDRWKTCWEGGKATKKQDDSLSVQNAIHDVLEQCFKTSEGELEVRV